MTARQNSKNSMYQSVLLILLANNLIYAAVVAMVAAVGKLETFLTELNRLIDKQQSIITGYAADKRRKRETMVRLAIKIKGAVQALAEDTNNQVLYDAVDFDESTLLTQRASYARSHCQNIYNEGNGVVAALANHGILPADLAALQLAITAFAGVISMPKAMKAELKTATDEIVRKMKEIDTLLKKKLDKQMLIYKSNPATETFWLDYTNSRKIYNHATHFTEVRAMILNAETNEPMEHVKMIIENGDEVFEEFSNQNGIADKKQISPEITDLTFEVPGFETERKTVTLSRGEKELLTIKMRPLA